MDTDDNTALIIAAEDEKIDCVKLLLALNCNTTLGNHEHIEGEAQKLIKDHDAKTVTIGFCIFIYLLLNSLGFCLYTQRELNESN